MTDTIRAALERLMPCPFCGSEAGLEDHRLLWVVRCSSCSACVLGDRAPEPEQELPESYWAPFRQSAVDRWNRRPSAPPAPEVGDVSDEELTQFLFERFRGPIEFLCDTEEESHLMIRSHVKFARAAIALDRSRHQPQPVAVSERLPGPEDCDAEGMCWLIGPKFPTWDLNYPPKTTSSTMWTHWLPAHAQPLPTTEATNG